jgi:hypothetical protein
VVSGKKEESGHRNEKDKDDKEESLERTKHCILGPSSPEMWTKAWYKTGLSSEKQKSRNAEKQKSRKAEKQKSRNAEMQKCRKAEKQKSRKAERQNNHQAAPRAVNTCHMILMTHFNGNPRWSFAFRKS